jgi:hypothetical protein
MKGTGLTDRSKGFGVHRRTFLALRTIAVCGEYIEADPLTTHTPNLF